LRQAGYWDEYLFPTRYPGGEIMIFRPNYKQQRGDRTRAKEQKKQARLQRREADAERRKAEREDQPADTRDAGHEDGAAS
jgi:hypothetical protein